MNQTYLQKQAWCTLVGYSIQPNTFFLTGMLLIYNIPNTTKGFNATVWHDGTCVWLCRCLVLSVLYILLFFLLFTYYSSIWSPNSAINKIINYRSQYSTSLGRYTTIIIVHISPIIWFTWSNWLKKRDEKRKKTGFQVKLRVSWKQEVIGKWLHFKLAQPSCI